MSFSHSAIVLSSASTLGATARSGRRAGESGHHGFRPAGTGGTARVRAALPPTAGAWGDSEVSPPDWSI
jgi:hypothetical protein